MNLVRVLYGSRAGSGLSDLVKFPESPPKPRWLNRGHIADVIRKVESDSKPRAGLNLSAVNSTLNSLPPESRFSKRPLASRSMQVRNAQNCRAK